MLPGHSIENNSNSLGDLMKECYYEVDLHDYDEIKT